MPTYQYACTACGHKLEAVQSFTDDPLTECPECAGRLRKLFSSVGIVFKGSGFYRTDSRNGGKDTAAKDTKEPASTGTSTPAKDGASANGSTKSGTEKSGSSTTSTTSSSSTPAPAAA